MDMNQGVKESSNKNGKKMQAKVTDSWEPLNDAGQVTKKNGASEHVHIPLYVFVS